MHGWSGGPSAVVCPSCALDDQWAADVARAWTWSDMGQDARLIHPEPTLVLIDGMIAVRRERNAVESERANRANRGPQ